MTRTVLFQLSGSIACAKATEAISTLVKSGLAVQTAVTKDALRFIGEATLEGLTGRPVLKDLFEAGRAMDHIALIREASVIVLAPATANILAKFANGIADDPVSTLFLAHDFKKPYLVAPAMNPAMWAHPATQANAKQLMDWGVTFVGPAEGDVACGETGRGRMVEAAELVKAILSTGGAV